jgi:hypothetical protein
LTAWSRAVGLSIDAGQFFVFEWLIAQPGVRSRLIPVMTDTSQARGVSRVVTSPDFEKKNLKYLFRYKFS